MAIRLFPKVEKNTTLGEVGDLIGIPISDRPQRLPFSDLARGRYLIKNGAKG